MGRLLFGLAILFMVGCATPSLKQPGTGQAESEAEQLREALKKHYEIGEGYYQTGKLDLARAEYLAMLDLKPEEENALYRLGTVAFKQRDFDLSANYFSRAIDSNPKNKKAHYNLANIRLMQAENHFKYYTALVDKDADLRRVSKLMADIDAFNTKSIVSLKKTQTGSLDALAGALKK